MNKKTNFPIRNQYRNALLVIATVLFSCTFALSQNADTTAKTAIGTSRIWGKVAGISFEGLVQGPSATVTPLQVACVFEYTEGDIFNAPALPAPLNGMVHLDEALKGQITELRKTGRFAGHALETLLLTPQQTGLKAERLLLIGLGDRRQFNAELMTRVGMIALREAVKLKVSSFAFASDIKDAGIDSPTALVAGNVTRGIIEAYKTQLYLQQQKLAAKSALIKVTLLAGPAFFTAAGSGISEAIASFNK